MKEYPNITYIKELSEGDVNFEIRLIHTMLYELPVELRAFKKHFESGDYHNAAELVHKLKHKISILGMEKGYDFAVNFENDLNKKKGLRDCKRFMILMKEITDYLNDQKKKYREMSTVKKEPDVQVNDYSV